MDNALNHRNQWALAKYMSTFEIPETMLPMLDLTVNNGKIYFTNCHQGTKIQLFQIANEINC